MNRCSMPGVARCIISLALAAPVAAAPVPALPIPKALSALCPPPGPGEIAVCADQEPAPSPYRAPIKPGPVEGSRDAVSVSRERNALVEMGMEGGGGSCTAAGAMGMYGCKFVEHKRTVEQRADARDRRGRVFDQKH